MLSITYPPERRASMSMSLGALTTVSCMLRTKGKYRGKWEDAVKKTLSHIPAINDFISLTEVNSAAEYVKPAMSLLGDILLNQHLSTISKRVLANVHVS